MPRTLPWGMRWRLGTCDSSIADNIAQMVWQGKALGALIGVFAAGPVGALFGTFIGHLFDVQAESARDDQVDATAEAASPAQIQEAFFRATFQAMGHLAKADGRVSEDE